MLGRVAAALTPKPAARPEPQHISAWSKGADGEQKVGRRLDEWAAAGGGLVLHDRRMPRSRANIDHIAVAPSGVWVIDAKRYAGRVQQVDRGGWLRTDLRLNVSGRDRAGLAEGVLGQMEVVAEALDHAAFGAPRPPVHGVLCFVGADWALLARPFVSKGVYVAWPLATIKLISQRGTATAEEVTVTGHVLATAFGAA